MPGWFASTEEDCIEFEDGSRAYIKAELTAGDQEALEQFMYGAGVGAAQGEMQRLGGLKMVQLGVLRLVQPDGAEIVPSYQDIEGMERGKALVLMEEIGARFRPLADLQASSGKSTTTTGGSANGRRPSSGESK